MIMKNCEFGGGDSISRDNVKEGCVIGRGVGDRITGNRGASALDGIDGRVSYKRSGEPAPKFNDSC